MEATTRQIQAPELVEDAAQVEPMVGRRARRAGGGDVPEADELVRAEPDLFELVADARPARPSARRSHADVPRS